VPRRAKCFFDIQGNLSHGQIVTDIQGHVVRTPDALNRRTVTCTRVKVARTLYVIFFNVPLGYSEDNFFKLFARCGYWHYDLGNYWSIRVRN